MRGSEKKEEKRKRRGDKEKEVGICNWTHHFTIPLREKREERKRDEIESQIRHTERKAC